MGTNKNSAVWPPFAFHWTRFIGATRWLVWWCREWGEKKKIDESGYTTARREKKNTSLPVGNDNSNAVRGVCQSFYLFFAMSIVVVPSEERAVIVISSAALSPSDHCCFDWLGPKHQQRPNQLMKNYCMCTSVCVCVFVPSFPNPFCPPPLLLPGVLAIFQVNAIQKTKKGGEGTKTANKQKYTNWASKQRKSKQHKVNSIATHFFFFFFFFYYYERPIYQTDTPWRQRSLYRRKKGEEESEASPTENVEEDFFVFVFVLWYFFFFLRFCCWCRWWRMACGYAIEQF